MAALDPDTARIDIGTMFATVWRRKGRIVLVTLGLLAATFVILMFVPKMYESSASILVESRNSTYLRASNDTGSTLSGGSVGDDMAIASQIELIQSRDTLLAVIDSEDLRDEPELNTASLGIVGMVASLFGPPPAQKDITETVLANMNDRLTVVRERDSRVISVLFRSESPMLAAKIANAIANAHVSRRAGLEISDTADASKWLETEIDRLRQKVADADAKVANFRIAHDLYNGKDGTSSLVDQQLSDISTQITQSQERQSTSTSRAGVLRALIQAGKPIDSVPAVQDSAVIAALAQQKSELQSKKAELLARLLPNHPNVVAISAQIGEIDGQMVAEGRRIADALDAEADIETKIQSSLRDQLTQLKTTASGDLTNGVTLAELDREAKAQRDLLETYLVRYRDAQSRTDVSSALPDVRVVTAAAAAIEPASPKTFLIMIAVLVVSLAGQIGYILFGELASGRAVVEGARVEPETEPVAAPEATSSQASAEKPAGSVTEYLPLPSPQARPAQPPADWAARLAAANPPQGAIEQGPATPPPNWAEQLAAAAANSPRQPPAQTAAAGVDYGAGPRATGSVRSTQYVPRESDGGFMRGPLPRRLPSALNPLVKAISAGKERIVLIAGLGDPDFAAGIVEQLGGACAAFGLGVATIDAASGRTSANPGISDLLIGAASFGDVVHADHAGHLARVPWGRQRQLDQRSPHGLTLAEALTDIYHVVLIATGQPGPGSSLPVFAGVDGYVVVASAQPVDTQVFEGFVAGAGALGFNRVQIVGADDNESQVA